MPFSSSFASAQMAMAIESFINLQTLTIEELCGRLHSVEENYDLDDVDHGVGKLLLTEEWSVRQPQHGQGTSSSGTKGVKGQHKPRPQGGDRAGGHVAGGKSTSGERRKGNCRYCSKTGH